MPHIAFVCLYVTTHLLQKLQKVCPHRPITILDFMGQSKEKFMTGAGFEPVTLDGQFSVVRFPL